MTLDPQDIALARGLLLLALVMLLVSVVFKMGVAIGWRASADDMQWTMHEAKQASEASRAEWARRVRERERADTQ